MIKVTFGSLDLIKDAALVLLNEDFARSDLNQVRILLFFGCPIKRRLLDWGLIGFLDLLYYRSIARGRLLCIGTHLNTS